MSRNGNEKRPTLPLVRCAIYTRKSTEEGLEQEFNSLDAQREGGEGYVKSQAHEGWTCLPDRYDDGGFTGGNTDRPALRRLFADIEAGKVDCVVCYKVDRLSRSLLDFAGMMQVFDRHKVSFVSITQRFDTSTSMGRLMLNVLLSFAQFEREIIAERTRDKVAATRRKGKWTGGMPVLGLDVDPRGGRLVVNEDEAVRVRAIFELYLEHQALLPVVRELEQRGWTIKRWQNRKGHLSGGRPFTKTNLHRLLTNVGYLGQVRYRAEVHPGEHPAIVDPVVWQKVQAVLQRNGRAGGGPVRNQFGALLRGLLHCVPCGCCMTPSHTTRNGQKRYRYYTCTRAQKRGWDACPTKSVPAAEVEKVVIDRIRAIGRDAGMLEQVLAQAREQDQARLLELEAEQRALARDLVHWDAQLRHLAGQVAGQGGGEVIARLAELQERIGSVERRVGQVKDQILTTRQRRVDEEQVRETLTLFDPVWQALTPAEQGRVVGLLVKRVEFDGPKGKLAITFHPSGIKTLAEELSRHNDSKEQWA